MDPARETQVDVQIEKIQQDFHPLEFPFDPSYAVFESARISVQQGRDMAAVRGGRWRPAYLWPRYLRSFAASPRIAPTTPPGISRMTAISSAP